MLKVVLRKVLNTLSLVACESAPAPRPSASVSISESSSTQPKTNATQYTHRHVRFDCVTTALLTSLKADELAISTNCALLVAFSTPDPERAMGPEDEAFVRPVALRDRPGEGIDKA